MGYLRFKLLEHDSVIIPFSAFWLRSSVVSVLISLIADTGSIAPYAINLISLWVAANAGLAQRRSRHAPGFALLPGVCTTPNSLKARLNMMQTD